MSPRLVHPNARYLITRRCSQRQFWLRPSKQVNQIFAYSIAVAAARTGVQVHAICVLSNHWHAIISDSEARLPEFLQLVHLYTAKAINALYGRWENLWSSEPPSAVLLVDDAAVLDKLAYCLANPVAAGLVARGDEWPGLRTRPGDLAGREQVVSRPAVYFSKTGSMPATATLKITRPVMCAELSDSELADQLEALVAAREAECRAEAKRAGRQFLGAEAVLRQRPSDSPLTVEPRRKLSPRVAARSKSLRIEALRRLKAFVGAYKEALELWRRGVRDVVFPAGTYAMRKLHSVACVEWSTA